MTDKLCVVQQPEIGRAELRAPPAPVRVRAKKNHRARPAAFNAQVSHGNCSSLAAIAFMEEILPFSKILRNTLLCAIHNPEESKCSSPSGFRSNTRNQNQGKTFAHASRHDYSRPVADVFTKAKRSRVMAAVRSKGNKETEMKLAGVLRRHKISGWRRQLPLVANPDFVFRRQRLAVFVDGCFWHGCPKHLRLPRTHQEYWLQKIARNRQRDGIVTRSLRRKGWRVLRIWGKEPTKRMKSRRHYFEIALRRGLIRM